MNSASNLEGQAGDLGAARTSIGALAISLLVLAGVFLFIANLLFWIDTTVFNRGQFTDAVQDTLDKPQVQQRLGEVIASQVVQSERLQTRVEEQVPERYSAAVPIVINQAEPVVANIATRIIGSELTGQITREVVPTLYTELLAILEDDDRRLGVQGDSLVLHMGGTADAVFQRLGIEPPASEGGGTSAHGDFVLVKDASYLGLTADLVKNRQEITIAMLIGAVASLGGAAWKIRNGREALQKISIVVVAVGIMTLLVVLISNWLLADLFEENVGWRELIKSFEVNLEQQSIALILIGAVGIMLTEAGVRRFIMDAYSNAVRAGNVLVERYGLGRLLLIAASAVVIFVLIF
jgi:hypothetical protein